MPPLRNNDVQGFEKFADLVRITVVKLKAEGRYGELGEGTLHSLLVKKLAENQLQGYSSLRKQPSFFAPGPSGILHEGHLRFTAENSILTTKICPASGQEC